MNVYRLKRRGGLLINRSDATEKKDLSTSAFDGASDSRDPQYDAFPGPQCVTALQGPQYATDLHGPHYGVNPLVFQYDEDPRAPQYDQGQPVLRYDVEGPHRVVSNEIKSVIPDTYANS